jgi:predicted nucleic acid-binding protein
VAPLIVFLDANVLFSAALGGPAFKLIWELAGRGRISLVTSTQCRIEAESNLERKRPRAVEQLTRLLDDVEPAPTPTTKQVATARGLVPEKDAPVLAAALAAGAAVLVTGDIKHFGPLMERNDLPLKVRTPRALLLEGEKGQSESGD